MSKPLVKTSNVAGKIPLESDLAVRELAYNSYDGKLYTKLDPYPVVVDNDIFYENTSLSLHMTGANNSVSFIDTSIRPKTITVNGTAKIDTSIPDYFGNFNGVANFDGSTNCYITTPAHTDFDIGTGDFTLEMNVRVGTTALLNLVAQRTTPTSNGIFIDMDATNVHLYLGNGTTWFVSALSVPRPPDNVMYNLTIVKYGTLVLIFINGILKTSLTGVTGSITTGLPFHIGADPGNSSYYASYISDLRLTKKARFLNNFVVKPFTDKLTTYTAKPVKMWNRQLALNSYSNDQVGSGWIDIQDSLNTQIAVNRLKPLSSGALVTTSNTSPVSGAFISGVLLPNGKVFIVPFQNTTARIYDPVTDTVTTPSGTYPGSGALVAGVLLPNGKVFMLPGNSTIARIYDPVTDTVTASTAVFPSGADTFVSAVTMADGRVFCVPYNSTTARIYDPVTDSTSTPSGTYPGSGAFYNGCLMSDGRIYMVPRTSTTARIYDPVTDTVTTPSGTFAITFGWTTGILMQNGNVFIMPAAGTGSTTARIYDPTTNALITSAATFPAATSTFYGGVLLPDGRIFCIPRDSTTARIYDPVTDTLTTPSGTYNGNNHALSGLLLPDGNVLIIPYFSTSFGLALTGYGNEVNTNLITSPFWNKF
jgi:hypothetical protein